MKLFMLKIIVFLCMVSYLAINLLQPYGNLLVFATASSRDGQSQFERFFVSEHISRYVLSLRGGQCDAPILTLPMDLRGVEYIPFEKNTIALLVRQYSLADVERDEKKKEYIIKLLVNAVNECNPDLYPDFAPPLVDAIIFGQADVVKLLLDGGADPIYEFIVSPGVLMTPLEVAKQLAEKDSSRVEVGSDSRHRERAVVILDIIESYMDQQ